jgi:hypothetical protein
MKSSFFISSYFFSAERSPKLGINKKKRRGSLFLKTSLDYPLAVSRMPRISIGKYKSFCLNCARKNAEIFEKSFR